MDEGNPIDDGHSNRLSGHEVLQLFSLDLVSCGLQHMLPDEPTTESLPSNSSILTSV